MKNRFYHRSNSSQIVVCGGGPAGIAAAIAAARGGCEVTLVERYGFLGGNLTAGLVNPMMTFHTLSGRQIIKGIAQEIVDRLVTTGGSPGHIPDPVQFVGSVTPFEPEVLKMVAEQMLLEAGVKMRYHALLIDAERQDNRLQSITLATKSGLETIHGEFFIDTTGDADLVNLAKEQYDIGRDADGFTQPMTLIFRIGNVDIEQVLSYVRDHPQDFHLPYGVEALPTSGLVGISGFFSLVQEAIEKKEIPPYRDRLLFFGLGKQDVIANVTRIMGLSGVDAHDLSSAETLGRSQAWTYFAFMRRHIPGFQKARLIQTGAQIGVRETRRLRGQYVLTEEDLLNGTSFPDTVALGAYPIDVHSPVDDSLQLQNLKPDGFYEIPLRSLMPQNVENLLVAGRCISSTHTALAALRVAPTAMATGEAAGRTAALIINEQQSVESGI
ncbi:MAG: FAD-dependent oxidoreductase [Firmicutes bacterium]|nr:FAD-dependent oxidoreductase [Bacillota bacterium]